MNSIQNFKNFTKYSSTNQSRVTVHGIFEIPNSKHQIPNKSQIPNTNDLNYFDFSSIDENIFFNSFASCIQDHILVCYLGFWSRAAQALAPRIGICLSFEICCLEFPLIQLLSEWIQSRLGPGISGHLNIDFYIHPV